MKTIIRMFVRHNVFANLLLLLIVVAGLGATKLLVRRVLPPFTVDTVQVLVPYPGAGPEEVEEGICQKIEEAIEGVQGIKEYTTVARENRGAALIEVNEDEDIQVVKDRISDRINAIQTFPDDAEKPTVSEILIQDSTLRLAITGDIPEAQLKELAEDVKEELLQLPAVSVVEVGGTREYEISIEVSEQALQRYGLTFQQVADIVRQASLNLPGGQLRSENEEIKIRTMGRRYRGPDFSEIVVLARPNGTSIRLDQIATIRDGFVEDRVYNRFNGMPAVSVVVFNADDEDAIRISDSVREYVKQRQATLPPGIGMHIWADSSRFVRERIDMLLTNGRIGLALVFILLWAFLDFRLAIWVSMGIPISLAGALALLLPLGESLNMISLFAMIMVLGIVVDDAIVIGEAIYVHRRLGKPPVQAAVDGTAEVAWPVFAAVTTTCVAFMPLFFVSGIMGKFIRVIPLVVISALLVSLVECLIILPAHLNDLPDFTGPRHLRRGLFMWPSKFRAFFSHTMERGVIRVYQPILGFLLSWRYVTMAGMFSILLLSAGLIRGGFVKFLFFPNPDTDFVVANVDFPEGTPLDVTLKAVEQLEQGLNTVAADTKTLTGEDMLIGVESSIGGRVELDGGGVAFGSHLGQIIVEMLGSEKRGKNHREIISEWEKATGVIAGAESVAIQGQTGGPPGMPIEIWILGEDIDHMREVADEVKERLESYAGVFQVEDDFRPGKRELRARLKPEARTLGFTTQSLASQIRGGFYGEEIVRVQRGRDEVKVWVRYPEAERRTLGDVDNIRVRTPDGREVPLATVADLQLEEGYTTITRKDGRRRIAVSADVNTAITNTTEVVQRPQAAYLSQVP